MLGALIGTIPDLGLMVAEMITVRVNIIQLSGCCETLLLYLPPCNLPVATHLRIDGVSPRCTYNGEGDGDPMDQMLMQSK